MQTDAAGSGSMLGSAVPGEEPVLLINKWHMIVEPDILLWDTVQAVREHSGERENVYNRNFFVNELNRVHHCLIRLQGGEVAFFI